MNHSTPGLPVHHHLLEFTQTHVHWVSDAIQPSHPLSSPSPPTPNPSQHQSLFQWVNSSHEVAKNWSFSFSIIPSKEIPGLNSFRMDWLDLLAVQGTLKSLLQHHSSKASMLRRSAFFTVQLSHPYMTTGKTIALTRWTLVGKVMSLLFNMLSRLVITFLPRSKRLLISWLQSLSAVILEPPKIKSDTVSTVSLFISHEVMGPEAMIFVFWMLSFKPTFSLSSFTLIKRLFSSSSLSAIRMVSSAYLRLLIFLSAILIPACVITHLKPDILESEVKGSLGTVTMNKASGGDGIPVELFQILKDVSLKVLHSICQQIWKAQEWPQNWKRSVFIPTPKKGNAKECSNYRKIALISHTSKEMLKILQARLQWYVNYELPNVQAGFRKGRGTRDQIANICCILAKARDF